MAGFIAAELQKLHEKRLARLVALDLKDILLRKNPYLFKSKHVTTAAEFIESVLGAFLSSQEETSFGGFMERLAILVSSMCEGGYKSGIKGIDLEFTRDGVHYIVSIKSGPNWGNAGQIEDLRKKFQTAKRTLNTNRSRQNVVAVNGCLYGREQNEDKGEYLKLCGQSFWEFLTGSAEMYVELVEPLGLQAKERKDEFQTELTAVTNRLTRQFLNAFCNDNGVIDWKKVVKFNSGRKQPQFAI